MKKLILLALLIACALVPQNWVVLNPPNLSAFTWVNQLTASWSTSPAGFPVLNIPYQPRPAQWSSLVQSITGSQYTVTMVFCPAYTSYGVWNFGISLQDSASMKAVNMMYSGYNSPGQLIIYQESDTQTYQGYENAVATLNIPAHQVHGFRVVEDGTHRTYFYSGDGGNAFQQVYQEPSGTYLTPAKWGVIGINIQGGTATATLYNLGVTYP